MLDLDVPIIQAPMVGGPSTPALAAAVSVAGGLGFLAAGYKSPEAVRAEIINTRELTTRPFGVNVFAPPGSAADPSALARYADRLRHPQPLWARPSAPPASTTTTTARSWTSC